MTPSRSTKRVLDAPCRGNGDSSEPACRTDVRPDWSRNQASRLGVGVAVAPDDLIALDQLGDAVIEPVSGLEPGRLDARVADDVVALIRILADVRP